MSSLPKHLDWIYNLQSSMMTLVEITLCRKSYKDLPEAEKQKVKNVPFIVDKFCIGDEGYHELSKEMNIYHDYTSSSNVRMS